MNECWPATKAQLTRADHGNDVGSDVRSEHFMRGQVAPPFPPHMILLCSKSSALGNAACQLWRDCVVCIAIFCFGVLEGVSVQQAMA